MYRGGAAPDLARNFATQNGHKKHALAGVELLVCSPQGAIAALRGDSAVLK